MNFLLSYYCQLFLVSFHKKKKKTVLLDCFFVVLCCPIYTAGIHVPRGLNCDQMEEGEQYSEHSVEKNPRAYMSMRDYRNPPWVSAPSYMVPPTNAPYGNAFNPSWWNHTNSSPPQYAPPPHPQSTYPTEETILNLTKLVGDFVGEQRTINAQWNQRIDTVERNLNQRLDGLQNDFEQKLDSL